jgi:DUF2075 family protein
MGLIQTFEYKHQYFEQIRKYKYGINWPVVYILRNKNEAYIGESTRVYYRSLEHYKNDTRRKLTSIDIITDKDFNKSATLELESLLIEHMSADGKFKLQNGNGGLSNHNYYQNDIYKQKFNYIWEELKHKGIVLHGLFDIRNSDLFKYSPYKALNEEQHLVVEEIFESIKNNQHSNHLIQGEPGTGKTIVAIYIIKYLVEALKEKNLKIALVVPMTSLRKTLQKVFKNVQNLSSSMVIGPSEVVGKSYDVLIVDEAHRLSRRVNITNMKSFDDCNRALDLDIDKGTQLDWIKMSSKHIVLCYDENQSIRPSDVRPTDFEEINFIKHKIKSQMRVLAGGDYIDYIHNILHQTQKEKVDFKNYELFLFDDIREMHNRIKEKDSQYGLSRIIAGYAWKWISKKDVALHDIVIDEVKFRWNSINKDWINSPNAINEIGCIHTTQGYDINYAGIIIGNEVTFKNGKIHINEKNYFDQNGKRAIKDPNELKKYILNIYKTILTRGIKGTYIYICDKDLRNYFRQYIPTFNSQHNVHNKEIIEHNIIGSKK